MKVCACVKVVPRAEAPLRLDLTTFRLDRTVASEVSPVDEFAIEEALLLRDALGGDVVAVSMTPESGVEALRHALALGADRAIAISDPLLEGSDLVVTARVLARVLQRESPDLVLFGSGAIDAGGAMLWSAVGELLGLPVVSGVRSVGVDDGRIRATRQTAGDEIELDAPIPSVVGLSGSVNAPHYPSFRDIVQARKKEIATITLEDLRLGPEASSAAARTRVLSVSPRPPSEREPEVIEDGAGAADWLFRGLEGRGLLPGAVR
jgi:electron transfer flavoprotein beta subunit